MTHNRVHQLHNKSIIRYVKITSARGFLCMLIRANSWELDTPTVLATFLFWIFSPNFFEVEICVQGSPIASLLRLIKRKKQLILNVDMPFNCLISNPKHDWIGINGCRNHSFPKRIKNKLLKLKKGLFATVWCIKVVLNFVACSKFVVMINCEMSRSLDYFWMWILCSWMKLVK